MVARQRMSGLRPHHFPRPVRVWEVFDFRSFWDSLDRRETGNWVSMKERDMGKR